MALYEAASSRDGARRRHRRAALAGAWIGARGRETASGRRSSRAPGGRAGDDLPQQQRESARAGKSVMKAVRAAFGEGGAHAGPLLASRRRPHRRDAQEARRQAGEHRPRLRVDADPADGDAPLHREGQATRRHDPDLRGVRRLRGDDGPPGAAGALDGDFRIDLGKFADAAKGAGLVFYCNPNNPTATYVGARATRDFLAKVQPESPDTTILVDEAYFDYVTDPDHDTHIPIAVDNPRVVVARTFSKAYGMAGLRMGYAVGHADTIKKMRDWDGGSGTGSLNVLALHAGHRRSRTGRVVHHCGARAQRRRRATSR